jgi:hypothetical protein
MKPLNLVLFLLVAIVHVIFAHEVAGPLVHPHWGPRQLRNSTIVALDNCRVHRIFGEMCMKNISISIPAIFGSEVSCTDVLFHLRQIVLSVHDN